MFLLTVDRLQQQIYIHLLKRYLHLKYGSEYETNEKFHRFLNILSKDLQVIQKMQIKLYKENNPQLYGPLVKELLDIEA